MIFSRKPMLSFREQLEHLKEKGITFEEGISERDALEYLKKNRNFYRLMAYRVNYKRNLRHYRNFGDAGYKYVDVDFAYLVDLCEIDIALQMILIDMTLRIESQLKSMLINKLTNLCGEGNAEIGYRIVADYLKKGKNLEIYERECKKLVRSVYMRDLLDKYGEISEDEDVRIIPDKLPVWVYVETLSFGAFAHFYRYCIDECFDLEQENEILERRCIMLRRHDSYQNQINALEKERKVNRCMKKMRYLIFDIGNLRNAVAHNSCMINDVLGIQEAGRKKRVDQDVLKNLGKAGISKNVRSKMMCRERVKQLIYCLYAYGFHICPGDTVKGEIAGRWMEFKYRMTKNAYYPEDSPMFSFMNFFGKVIDGWFGKQYN